MDNKIASLILMAILAFPIISARVSDDYLNCVAERISTDCQEVTVWTNCKQQDNGTICDKKIEAPNAPVIKSFLSNHQDGIGNTIMIGGPIILACKNNQGSEYVLTYTLNKYLWNNAEIDCFKEKACPICTPCICESCPACPKYGGYIQEYKDYGDKIYLSVNGSVNGDYYPKVNTGNKGDIQNQTNFNLTLAVSIISFEFVAIVGLIIALVKSKKKRNP